MYKILVEESLQNRNRWKIAERSGAVFQVVSHRHKKVYLDSQEGHEKFFLCKSKKVAEIEWKNQEDDTSSNKPLEWLELLTRYFI